jgi:hypothetical protein
MSIDFITNEELYKQVIVPVANATSFVWIGLYNNRSASNQSHYESA